MKRFTFDTETTGIEPGSRLVEIHSALLGDDGAVMNEFHSLVNPGMPIPADATATHGITDADVATKNDVGTVLDCWLAWLANHNAQVGIAHFAPYDVGIIGWGLGRADLQQPQGMLIIDTCAMAKAIKATKKNSLDALVEHYGITRQGQAHRAACDSLACREYFLIAEKLTAVQPVPWAPEYRYPAELPKHLAELPKAVAHGDRFRFTYVDAKGNRTEREIIPYGYAETDKGISFHGLCLMRNERRTFLADRVEA